MIMGPDDIYEFEEMDELGIDPHLNLEGGFDDELGASENNPTPYDSAIGLRDFLIRTNNFGSDNNKVPEIATYQKGMGLGTNAIGIVGPRTRARATDLGVTLPQPKANTTTVKSTNLVTKTVAELQKLLYGVGWTTKKLANDPRFGPQTVRAWKTSTNSRKVPNTINRISSSEAAVDKGAYARMVADQSKQTPKTEPKKEPTATPKQAAEGLRKYLERTGSFGSDDKRDSTVREYQRLMGMGSNAIGIVGPRTRAKAKSLGSILPANPAEYKTKPKQEPKTPATPKVGEKNPTPRESAAGLKKYLERTGSFGSDKQPDTTVKQYQFYMQMGKDAIGIVGPKTRKLAKILGSVLPEKPSSHKPNKPTPAKPSSDTAKRAASGLKSYLEKTSDFGSDNHKSSNVKTFQAAMGMGSDAIGIVGPKTRARAKALGVTLPQKASKPNDKPKDVTPKQAAQALKDYLIRTSDFGSDDKKSPTVKEYQRLMGMGSDAIGIVGPKTRAKAKRLGVTLPDKASNKNRNDDKKPDKEEKYIDNAALAKQKLAIIDRLSDAYPDFKIWDTMKFRKQVIDLLKIAAGKV